MGKEERPPISPSGRTEDSGHPRPLPPGGFGEDERDRLIHSVAEKVVRRGMAVPAIFFLETCKPLSLIGSQVMVFFGPFVQALYPFHSYYDFAALMEDRRNVERLLVEIERLEDESQKRERERKAERKKERERTGREGKGKRWRFFKTAAVSAGRRPPRRGRLDPAK